MNATEFLLNARDLNRLIDSTQETLENLTPPRSQLSGRVVGAASVRENKEPAKQVRRHELEEKLEKYMESLFDYKEALVRILTSSDLTPREKIIVEQRYMLSRTWKEIAAYMDYDVDYIKKLDKDLRHKLDGKTYYFDFVRR